MLSKSDILGAINLKVDYCMSAASLDEHGWNLIAVNHYELCAIDTLEQNEWWSFVHCMYSIQDCLNYNTTEASASANQTCVGAETGADDDMELSGSLSGDLDSCECSLEGVVDYCSAEYTSTTLSDLKECAYSDHAHKLAEKSKHIAENVNYGDPLWIHVNNMTLSLSTNEAKEIGRWAEGVKFTVCKSISTFSGETPKSCKSIR